MARKDLRRLLDKHGCEKPNLRVTDQRLFMSEEFRSFADSFVIGILGTRRNICIKYNKYDKTIAFTDGNRIYLNAANPITRKYKSQQKRALTLIGVLAHECAHILYLDFETTMEADKALKNGQFLGDDPIAGKLTEEDEKSLSELEIALADKNQRKLFSYVFNYIDNIIADAHDEACICRDYGGFVPQGITLTSDALFDNLPTLESMLEEAKPLSIMFQLLLEYARYDTFVALDYDKAVKNEYVKHIEKMLPFLKAARSEDDYHIRIKYINRCILELWPYIKSALDEADNQSSKSQSQQGASNGSQEQSSRPQTQSQQGASSDSQEQSSGHQTQPQQGETNETQEQSVGQQSQSKQGAAYGSQGQNQQSQKGDADGSQIHSNGSQSPSMGQHQPSQNRRIPPSEQAIQEVLDQLKAGSKGTTQVPQNQQPNKPSKPEKPSNAPAKTKAEAEDLMKALAKSVLNKLEEDAMEQAVENAIADNALIEVNAASQTSPHKGLPIRTVRKRDVTTKDIKKYNEIMDKIRPYSRQMKKKVGAILEELREGSTDRHLFFGRDVEATESYRRDGRFFANKKQPQDLPDMAIAVLVDQSGSMCGERLEAAIEAAILLDDFATSLGIPVAVIGHNTDNAGFGTFIYLHALFERAGNKDRYRLTQMSADGCNRDGMALNIVVDMLAKRPEEIKLLIVISDGQPNAKGYGGDDAERDIKKIVSSAKNKGIQTFAAAIGSDKERIRSIYGQGFLNVSDLATLPKMMVRLISKRLV